MEFVKGTTSDHDLIKLAEIIGVRLNWIYSIDEINKPLARGSYLILLRNDDSVGHWVAVHNDEYFDPTGVGPPTALGDLKYNEFQYQSTYAQFCGVWCLLWLYTKQKHKPELLEGFSNLNIDVLE